VLEIEIIHRASEWYEYWGKALAIAKTAENRTVDDVLKNHYGKISFSPEFMGFSTHLPHYMEDSSGKTKHIIDETVDVINTGKKNALENMLKRKITAVGLEREFIDSEYYPLETRQIGNSRCSLIDNSFLLQYLLVTPAHLYPQSLERDVFVASLSWTRFPADVLFIDSMRYLRNKHPDLWNKYVRGGTNG
jgi:hypothetical protein